MDPGDHCMILGARGLAREVADLASEIPGREVAGFVEKMEPERCCTLIEGLPVCWVDELATLSATLCGICALDTTKRSPLMATRARYGLRFATAIHPAARVSSPGTVGDFTGHLPRL